MIFVPFIYFLCLTLYVWHKHRAFDVCVVMTGLYALTSLLAMIVYLMDELEGGGILYGDLHSDIEIGVVPTVIYCVVLSLTLLPFTLVSESKIERIVNNAPWTMYLVSWVMICQFFLTLYLVVDSTYEILSGDLSALRASHYNGEMSPAELKALTLPVVLQYYHYMTYSTILSMPLFFYYLCFEKKPWWFLTLLFMSTLTMPIAAIQVVDRTEFVYYGLMFVWCVVFFRRFMTKRQKVKLGLALSPLALGALAYFVVVTVARFDDSRDKENKGAAITALQYAGQGFLNFCYFWEYGNGDYPTIERVMPMTSHMLFHVDSTSEHRAERGDRQQGFRISVFGTFIGDVLLDLGFAGMVMWALFFAFVCCMIFQTPHRTEFNTGELLAIFMVSAVPLFGLFYYRYYLFTHFFTLFFVAVSYFMSKYTIRL